MSSVSGKNYYTYSASGVKLKTVHMGSTNLNYVPVFGSSSGDSNFNEVTTTEYIGNKVYENNVLKKILVEGGYYDVEKGKYFFYVQDHLGNNRLVADENGTVTQATHYYPFGQGFANSEGQSEQPYKYNGKEQDRRHGLNLYDYSARYYEPAIGRFTTVDPHAENYYSSSPYAYAYVLNNPLKYIDPTGCDTIYAYKDGTEFERIKAPKDDVTIYGPSEDVDVEGKSLFAYAIRQEEKARNERNVYGLLTLNDLIGLSGTFLSAYGGSIYTPNSKLFGYGHYKTTSGKTYSLSVLELQASGRYIHGVNGHRLGAQNALVRSNVMRGIGTGVGWTTTLYSGYSMYKEPNAENGLYTVAGIAGTLFWPVGIMTGVTLPTFSANKAQIEHNIATSKHPLNNTVNPTTGEYYVPGYFGGFGF